MLKSLLLFVCSLVVISPNLFSQQNNIAQKPAPNSRGNPVETEKARISGDITIKLKPHMIYETPDQFILMTMEAKFTGKRTAPGDAVARTVDSTDDVFVMFDSQAKVVTDFGDKELHFIVDGKRISLGKLAGGVGVTVGSDHEVNPEYRMRDRFVAILKTEQMKKIAGGNHIEMRLGKYQMTFAPNTLNGFRSFVAEFMKYVPSSESKEKHP